MFKDFPVYKAADYDDECVAACMPRSPMLSNKAYALLVSDSEKLDQIAQILIRYNSLPTSL